MESTFRASHPKQRVRSGLVACVQPHLTYAPELFDMVINSNLKSAFITVTDCFELLADGAT